MKANATGDLEKSISRLLRAGVWSSLFLIWLGVGSAFILHPEQLQDRHANLGSSIEKINMQDELVLLPRRIVNYDGIIFHFLGLMLLIATPVMRVIASLKFFLSSKDRAYALITLSVLVLLIASFAMGAWVG